MMLIGIIIFGAILYIIYFNKNKQSESDDELIRCYNCGHILEEDYNYCPNCRERLKKKCESCGKPIGVNWRYCPYCNHPNTGEKVEK